MGITANTLCEHKRFEIQVGCNKKNLPLCDFGDCLYSRWWDVSGRCLRTKRYEQDINSSVGKLTSCDFGRCTHMRKKCEYGKCNEKRRHLLVTHFFIIMDLVSDTLKCVNRVCGGVTLC